MFRVQFKQVISVASLIALAGCGSHSTNVVPQSQLASHAAAPATVLNFDGDLVSPDAGTQFVGVRLTGETAFVSPTYGRVQGYFRGLTSHKAQVVQLTAATNVFFKNVDSVRPHTASFLGNATKHGAKFPAHFNGSSSQSPAGTAIGTSMFSTGALSSNQTSLKYTTGSPGFYMFGCAFHYDSDGMRTVIIVK